MPISREYLERASFSGGGFNVAVDAVVFDGNLDYGYAPDVTLGALALLGPREALRAIWASLILGKRDCYLKVQWRGEAFERSHPAKLLRQGEKGYWKKVEAAVPDAAAHHLIIYPLSALAVRPDVALGERCLLLPARQGLTDWPTQAVRFLRARVPFHLYEDWGPALWQHLHETEQLEDWRTWGFPGDERARWLVPDQGRIQAFLTAAIGNGLLQVPGLGYPAHHQEDEEDLAAD